MDKRSIMSRICVASCILDMDEMIEGIRQSRSLGSFPIPYLPTLPYAATTRRTIQPKVGGGWVLSRR